MRWALVRTEAVRPRAFVAPRWRWVPEGEAVEAVFTGAHARDAALVVLTGAGPPAPPDRDGLPLSPCRIDAYVPERIRLDCDSPAGGYAVLAEENAPGWSARVDGQAVALVGPMSCCAPSPFRRGATRSSSATGPRSCARAPC